MNYNEAKKKIFRGRLIGGSLFAVAGLTFLISCLKFLYYGLDAGDPLSHALAAPFQRLVSTIYLKTEFLNLFWEYAPTPDARNHLSLPNFYFALVYLAAFIGTIIFRYANALAKRVGTAEQIIDDERIRHSIRRSALQHDRTSIEDQLEILPPNRDSIWKQFHTLYFAPLIVTIVGGVMAAVLIKYFHLG